MKIDILIGLGLFIWCLWLCYQKKSLIDERIGTVFTFVIAYMYSFHFAFHFAYFYPSRWYVFVGIAILVGTLIGILFRLHTILLGISIGTIGTTGGIMLQITLSNPAVCGIQSSFSSSQILVCSIILTVTLCMFTVLLLLSYKRL